jgi:hypothetical protein
VASSASSGSFGANYLHDGDTGATGGKTATYTPVLPEAGEYEVFALWTSHPNRADNTPIDIHHAGGTSTVTVNQKINGGTWHSLGTYTFAKGTGGKLVIRNDGANGYVVADAARWVWTSDPGNKANEKEREPGDSK